MTDRPHHPEARTASVADIVEPVRGEFYIVLGIGDGTCERWRLTKSQVRWLTRRGVNSSSFDEDRMGRQANEMLKGDVSF